MTTSKLGQATTGQQPPARAAQEPLQADLATDQRDGDRNLSPPAPTVLKFPTLDRMKVSRRWLVADATKIPHYVSGKRRSGSLDVSADVAQLASYDEAVARVALLGPKWRLGFALGPDAEGGCWQGIDFDDVVANRLSEIANNAPGYVEVSPSGVGQHAIGYGREFATLGPNRTGLEAYSRGRYFTVTERPMRDGGPLCLADFVEGAIAPRHGLGRPLASAAIEPVWVDPKTVTELRMALASMRSDDRDVWVKMGHALKELGEQGRGLWIEWSQTSEKYEPKAAGKTWDSFKPQRTSYQAVFSEAQRQGWLNPMSKLAQIVPPPLPAATEFQTRKPRNFLTTASAPALDLANVPYPIANFAQAFSAAHGFDRSGAVMAAIASAAAVIDDDYVLEAKPGWRISARLWTVLIGKSAAGKSPTIKAATAPVKALHAHELKAFYAFYKPEPEERVERPPEPAIYTSDTTIEALSERLRNNPRGMLMLTEEFSSWIGSIDSSAKGEAAKNRGGWLQLYDGGPYQIDRIGRKSYQVPNWGASVLTATTPSALAEHMKHLPEDGLIQRFIPVILAARDYDADGNANAAQQLWHQALSWVFYNVRGGTVQFSAEARAQFRAVEAKLGRMATAMDDMSPALASHIGKHSEMVARIALVFHVFESQPGTAVLSAETLQKAIRLMQQLQKHSLALFTDILGRSPATEVARALARSLAAAAPLPSIGRDWMTQHCRAFEKANDDRVRREAVQLLEDLDWLKDVSARTYGGWPTKWEVNQNLFRLYAREGEAHRAQRAAVQALFGDQQGEVD